MNFLWRLKRRVHSSWLLALFCVGVLIGAVTAASWSEWFFSISWLVIGLVIGGIGLWRGRVYALPLVLIAGSLVGLWRGSIDQRQLVPYQNLVSHQVQLAGIVSEDTDVGKKGELLLRLRDLKIDGHELAGQVWVSARTKVEIQRSDQITVQGKLAAGFGTFAAAMYQAKVEKVERPQPGDVALKLRDDFAEKVRTVISEPEASLGLGYLVGQRRSLPPELDQALLVAGLTHIVVASGYNLTILVRLTRRAFARLSKYLAAVSGVAMIVGFMAITGASPSMSRAGLVTGLSLLAWYYGRKFHPFVLLPLAAAVTILINPSYAWNDLGWQLSFAAFAGVMIVAPLGQRFFFGDKKPKLIRQILGETIAAQIMTLPILLLAFGQLSNVAVVANLLILPFVPLAMLLVFVTGIAVIILPFAAPLVGGLTEGLLQYMVTITQYMAGLAWSQTTLNVSWVFMAIYYVLLVAIVGWFWYKTRFNFREHSLVE